MIRILSIDLITTPSLFPSLPPSLSLPLSQEVQAQCPAVPVHMYSRPRLLEPAGVLEASFVWCSSSRTGAHIS